MGLFGGSKSSSSSKTYNYQYTTSQSLGDLSTGNIQSTGNVTVNGMWGEDMQAFLDSVSGIVSDVKDLSEKATAANSDIAGAAMAEVAQGYQSAYSETTGILQQLKPVLMVGAGILAIIFAPKILRGL